MHYKFDIDVVGGGNAGVGISLIFQDTDQSIAFVEDRELGLIGHHGVDLVHIFAPAMQHGITATDLKDSPTTHPTLGSDIQNV